MKDPDDARRQVPYLLQLLDDDAAAVRRRVMHALEQLGSDLEPLAEPHLPQLNADQHSALRRVLARQRKAWLRERWPSWAAVEGRRARIEAAFSLLARFQLGVEFPLSPGDLLDGLADDFRISSHPSDAFGLARFLFKRWG